MINITNIIFFSPLDQFEVVPLFSINAPLFGDINLTLTNLGFYAILVLAVNISLHLLTLNNIKIVPGRWILGIESLFASLHIIVKEQIGISKEFYLPFVYSLFTFILLSNLIGNLPYSFAISTSAVYSIGLSFIVFFGVTILSLAIHQLHFFSYFVPGGTPTIIVFFLVFIELISYVARAFSLGVRLFANIVAGHALLNILASFLYPMITAGILFFFVSLIPFTLFVALAGLECAVSVIQAYVFTILTCIYLRDAIYLH
jgi:F-type H+-transporting ATPase subunit a